MSKAKAEISFYQLMTHPLEKVLPKLLEKVYESGLRALVVASSNEQAQSLNASLWTYSPGAFLPHGMKGSNLKDDPQDHPIWVTIYPFPMISPVFGHRSEAVFSSPISPSREPTLGVETGSKIPPHLEPKIPAKSSGMGIDAMNENGADVLVLTGGQFVEDLSSYSRCVDIFDGNSPTCLTSAQSRRDAYLHQNHPVIYWQQSLKGTWDQVALP